MFITKRAFKLNKSVGRPGPDNGKSEWAVLPTVNTCTGISEQTRINCFICIEDIQYNCVN